MGRGAVQASCLCPTDVGSPPQTYRDVWSDATPGHSRRRPPRRSNQCWRPFSCVFFLSPRQRLCVSPVNSELWELPGILDSSFEVSRSSQLGIRESSPVESGRTGALRVGLRCNRLYCLLQRRTNSSSSCSVSHQKSVPMKMRVEVVGSSGASGVRKNVDVIGELLQPTGDRAFPALQPELARRPLRQVPTSLREGEA